jgi:proton glutamate symport protein
MPLALRVLIGLVAGVVVGRFLAPTESASVATAVAAVATVGTVFVNLIRMTIIPLVVSMLIASLGGLTSLDGIGRIGIKAAWVSVAVLFSCAVGSAVIAQQLFAGLNIDPMAIPASSGSASDSAAPTVQQWFVDLVPSNVFKAASDGAMLPLISFAILFGVALTGIDPARRASVVGVAAGISEAMQRLVSAILRLAPLGVFALALPMAAKMSMATAGSVAIYIGVVVTLTVVGTLVVLYPVGIMGGPLSTRCFVSFCAPAQASAFASRSSMAGLPVMVQSAESVGLAPIASRLILPISVTLFRPGAAIAQTVGVLFLARLFQVPLSIGDIAIVIVAVVLTSFAVPGIPGGSIIAMVPVLAAARIPVEGIAVLLAVDTIPDMFRTTANLTGMMSLAAVFGRSPAADGSAEPAAGAVGATPAVEPATAGVGSA